MHRVTSPLLVAVYISLWTATSTITSAWSVEHSDLSAIPDSQREDSPFSPRWHPGRRFRSSLQSAQAPVAPAKRVPASGAETRDVVSLGADATLVQVAFVHRHGARTAPEVINGLLSWHWCHLSTEGTLMAVKLGQYVRQRYNSIIGAIYDADVFASRSTDYERTIRTAYGVVSGAFPRSSPGNNFSYPYLYHPPMDDDKMLSYYYSWGAAMLHQVELNSYNQRTASETLAYFPLADLQRLGAIVDAGPECATPDQATSCALLLEDVTTCMLSNDPTTPQLLLDYLTPQYMYQAQQLSLRYIYSVNASSPYHTSIGPYAMRLVTRVIEDFKIALAQPPTTRVYHYSAHDVTLFGLFVALGAVTADTTDFAVLVPKFTSATFFELYSNGSVTVVYAETTQPHGTSHDFSVDPRLQLRCMTPAGTEYRSSNCQLDDWARFIQTLNISTLLKPDCFALPQDVDATNCAPWESTSSADITNASLTPDERTLRGYCITFRQFCPEVACNTGLVRPPSGLPDSVSPGDAFVLDRATWQCKKTAVVAPPSTGVSRPPAALTTAFLGLAGLTTAMLLVVSIMECAGAHRTTMSTSPEATVAETSDLIAGEERLRSSVGRHREHKGPLGTSEPFMEATRSADAEKRDDLYKQETV